MFCQIRCIVLLVALYFCVYSFAQNTVTNENQVYRVADSWDSAFQAKVKIRIIRNINRGWRMRFRFASQLDRFECWQGEVETAEIDNSLSSFSVTNKSYNGVLEAGDNFEFTFIGHYLNGAVDPTPPPVTIYFQNRFIYRSPELIQTTTSPVSITTTDIIYVLNRLTASSRPPVIHPIQNEETDSGDSSSSSTINNNNNVNNNNNNNNNNSRNNSNNNNAANTNLHSIHLTNEDINRINAERNRINNILNQQNNQTNEPEGSGEVEAPVTTTTQSTATVSTRSTTTSRNTASTGTEQSTTTRSRPVPIQNVTTRYDYAEVLHKSLLFYEAQRSGRLPADKRLRWTVSSALNDQGTGGEDLTGGYYDAGDYVKFNFPMAFSVTVLAWGVIEYWDAYEATGELQYALDALRWGADYFVKAHVAPFELYGQVGDGDQDHSTWGRPEDISSNRPAYKITKSNPGSDLAGETSAALSAVSLAIRKSENGRVTPYVAELLRHANQLYIFARNFRRKYHISIEKAEKFYKSTHDKDEITWAAAWLYRATGDNEFLEAAQGQYQNWALFVVPTNLRFSWDDKRPGLQMLLAQISGVHSRRYSAAVEAYCHAVQSSRGNQTSRGLLYLDDWSPLRYAANSAFICIMAAENDINPVRNFNWGRQQIHYMLGDSGRSYVVGFGRNPPKRPHHRASSCPPRPRSCGWEQYNSRSPNPITLQGALVGGPDRRDRFHDNRKNFRQNEVALDHNACFQGAIAALQYKAMFPNTPISRTSEPWYRNEQRSNNEDGGRGSSLRSCHSSSLMIWTFSALALITVNYKSNC